MNRIAKFFGFWTMEDIANQYVSPYAQWWDDYRNNNEILDPKNKSDYLKELEW